MMMMNMGGSGGGSMSSMGGSSSMGSMGSMGGSSGSMGMMSDPSMMNMGSMGGSNSMAMGQMPMNAYGYPPGMGFDFVSLIGVLLNFAMNLLSLVLVLALIVGTIVFIKRYLFEGNFNLAGMFSSKGTGNCPCCGQPIANKEINQQQTETKKA